MVVAQQLLDATTLALLAFLNARRLRHKLGKTGTQDFDQYRLSNGFRLDGLVRRPSL
jgi:hypothetical protein